MTVTVYLIVHDFTIKFGFQVIEEVDNHKLTLRLMLAERIMGTFSEVQPVPRRLTGGVNVGSHEGANLWRIISLHSLSGQDTWLTTILWFYASNLGEDTKIMRICLIGPWQRL